MADKETDHFDGRSEVVTPLGALTEVMGRLERERRRVTPEDWATLFRQMQSVLRGIADHPFIAGDLHAEHLIGQLAGASDLAELDRRVDILGEYIAGKIAYNVALKAAHDGIEPDPTELLPRKFGASAPGTAKVMGIGGPSGSDFDVSGDNQTGVPYRGFIRL